LLGSTATESAAPPAFFTAINVFPDAGNGSALAALNGTTSVPLIPSATNISILSGEIAIWRGIIPASDNCFAVPVVIPVEELTGIA
jgi:hypothetical protein